MGLVLLIFLSSLAVLVNSQGESCTAYDKQRGQCVALPNCNSLISLYRQDRSQNTINILLANQKSCGNRKSGRNPLMCCSDGVPQQVAPPMNQRTGPPCRTPDEISGYCINVKQCPVVLNTFIQRQKDPEYIQYIRNSNARCDYAAQTICCPNEDSPATQPPPPQTSPASLSSRSQLFTPPRCGMSKVPHNRVVGGAPAKQGGWPWMALLGYRNDLGELGWKCGGSIISNRHILTAAHCIRNDLFVVRLGEHDLSDDTEAQHVDIPVKQKIVHPSYDKKDGNSDVAILVLENDIPFSTQITPVCIPLNDAERTRNFVGYTPFAAGWGRTQEGGRSANVLQEIQLPVVDNNVCKENYAAINKVVTEKQFNDAVLCAGYEEGGRDTCNGDSGGPLMFPLVKNGEANYYQIGIVSYGIGCARAQVPGVYARVATFSDWIKNIVETT
ncbi:unnamed protein product [Chironomus riparius]|uniref:CLIP domain-containing serine protease n=1 Tax=Chironomus riparius TaxID=315576 RepID=A0A9N9WMJ8_9DIPT|nr:unnamed protein product [Chironomus riparius]